MSDYTICWECKRAIGDCRWSASLIPVEGWVAIETKKDTPFQSYIVQSCPLFERDAYGGGLKRYKPETKDDK